MTTRATGRDERWRVAGLCLGLAAITFAVFGQTLHYGFINFDDNTYVYENPVITQGLTFKGIQWAFTHVHSANWHPLTGISHMLDCQLYGLQPGGHHLTNVLLHTATVIALFLVLRAMTGALWRSAFVAAVFAIHPLRVESVAWVAERKDVLSGLFFMLTIGAYVRYARRPQSRARYGLVMLLFAMGLMCKPMLVTLPLILLLLDYWPLRRAETQKFSRLLLEKLPLLALSGASCFATLLAQREFIQSVVSYSLPLRFANALVSCMVYLRQMIWPAGLAVLYPYPHNGLPPWEVALAATLLIGLSAAAWRWRRKQPWLLTGWLWYLVMLLPVLGMIQVGTQAHADRYTYLPQIGICVAVTWLAAEWQAGRIVFGSLMIAVVGALFLGAWKQTTYWKDNETLWNHTISCTKGNFEAHNNLGSALMAEGKVDDAIAQFQDALLINPRAANAHNNLATGLEQKGRKDEAIAEFQQALQINPGNGLFHFNLAKTLQQQGRMAEAIAQYQMALQIDPTDVGAQINLAWLLATSPQASLRNGEKAVQLARQANELTGGKRPFILHTLAAAYAEAGKFDDAVRTAQNAIELAQAAGRRLMVTQISDELKSYEAGKPYREGQ